MRADVEGLALERLHLQILQNEVMRRVTLVDGILQREGITYVHLHLCTKRIKAIDFGYRLV